MEVFTIATWDGRYGNKEMIKSSEEIKLPSSLGNHVLYMI
jgi:hypothetical protein